MPDTFLIDGYNLIHALGMIQNQLGPGGLEASRHTLLEFLVQGFADDAGCVTIVFDARQSPRGVARVQSYHGLSIQFAPKAQSADDVIETLIDEHAEPKKLVVISNDMRLRNAANRRGARAWSHEALLEYFETRKVAAPKAPDEPRNEEGVSPEEARQWLEEFKDVENDPDLKEFFDHDRFDEK